MKSIFENRLSGGTDSFGQLSDRQKTIVSENRVWDGIKAFGRGVGDAVMGAADNLEQGYYNLRNNATARHERRALRRDAEAQARDDIRYQTDLQRFQQRKAAIARRQQLNKQAAANPAAFTPATWTQRTAQNDTRLADAQSGNVKSAAKMYTNGKKADETLQSAYGDAAVETYTTMNGGKAPSKKMEKDLRSGDSRDAVAAQINGDVTPAGNDGSAQPQQPQFDIFPPPRGGNGGRRPQVNPIRTATDNRMMAPYPSQNRPNDGIDDQTIEQAAEYMKEHPEVWQRLMFHMQGFEQ